MKINRATSPIVYRRIRSEAQLGTAYSYQYEKFVREERARTAQRRALTIVFATLVVVFALVVGAVR